MYTISDDLIERIKEHPHDYSGYILLGDYFFNINIKQAYLCYENALFWCEDKSNPTILEKMNKAIEAGGTVPKSSMVILSYNNRQLTQQCIESIRQYTPVTAREIVVVDNASADDSVAYLREQRDIVLIENKINMGFPKGCNQGIEVSGIVSDILLLNNDVVVMPNALYWLRMGLYADENIGAAGSVANKAYMQWSGERDGTMEYFLSHAKEINVPMKKPLEYRTWLIGFCLLLKRTALDKIGVLDEGFSPGNGEDEDICLRMLLAGYYNVLVLNSYMVHMEHASFNKRKDYSSLINLGWKRIYDKYGCDLDPYFYGNVDLTSLMSRFMVGEKVLELNSGMGASLYKWKSMFPEVEFEGIDRHVPTGKFRKPGSVINQRSYSDISSESVSGEYDCIVFDAYKVDKREIEDYLQFCSKHLRKTGRLILLIPYGCYYKNWYDQMINGKTNDFNVNVATIQDVESLFPDLGFQLYEHLLYYNIPERDEENKVLYSVVDSLPEEIRHKVFINESAVILDKK